MVAVDRLLRRVECVLRGRIIRDKTFPLGEGNFPAVAALGYVSDIPTVLTVDGGSNDVRITNLTYPSF